MSRKHLTYRDLSEGTKAAAKDFFDARPWSNVDAQQDIAQAFANAVTAEYGVDAPLVMVEELEWWRSRTSVDVTEEGTVVALFGFSALNLFAGVAESMTEQGVDLDPASWACSLYYAVKPVRFRKIARQGRVSGVTAKDTFTTASWRRLRDAGLTYGDRLGVDHADAVAFLNNEGTSLSDDAEETFPEDRNLPEGESDVSGPDAGMSDDGLSECNRDTLRRLAAEHNIAGRGTMTRDQLEAALRSAGVQAHATV